MSRAGIASGCETATRVRGALRAHARAISTGGRTRGTPPRASPEADVRPARPRLTATRHDTQPGARARRRADARSSRAAALRDPQPRRLARRNERTARMEATARRESASDRVPRPEGSAAPSPPPRGRRTADARVYGWRGFERSSSAGPSSTIRPRYITAMRSAMFQARPRSCVTTRIVTPASWTRLEHQLEDLSAHRGIEARDRLVGDEERRVQHHRAGDHHALALSAGELVRIELEEPLGRTKTGAGECVSHPNGLVAGPLLNPEPLGHRLVDGLPRIQRSHRILEDHLHLSAIRAEEAAVVAERLALVDDLALRGTLEPHDRPRKRRLSAARLADEREHLAPPHVEIDAVDSARDLAAAAGETGRGARVSRAASRSSSTPAPRRGHTQRGAPSPAGHSSTSGREHSATATGQRGWNGHPIGIARGSGGSPASPDGFMRCEWSPIRGNAAASAAVYGCGGRSKTSSASPPRRSVPRTSQQCAGRRTRASRGRA